MANAFNQFEDLAAERSLTRLDAMAFVSHFQFFKRSEHGCPKGIKRFGYKGVHCYGTLNMNTVCEYCDEHDEPIFEFLKWLDKMIELMQTMNECIERAMMEKYIRLNCLQGK